MHLSSIKKKISGPDGLEAWAVACAACFINFVQAGLARISGIIFVELMKYFNVERRQASLPISIRSSTRNLLGPVVGILGQKYGVRRITVIGGIIGSVSAGLCFFADTIWAFTLIWGIFNGLGTAMTTTLAQVLIQKHFKKYRTTAVGMTFSGGCVGSFLFPALIDAALHEYGFSGTFLIIAGIIANVLPAAWILKEPSWINKETGIEIVTINNDEREKEKKNSNAKRKTEVHFLLEHEELVLQLLSNDFLIKNHAPEGIPCISKAILHRILCKINSESEKPINGELYSEKIPIEDINAEGNTKDKSLSDAQSNIQVSINTLLKGNVNESLNKEMDSFITLLEKLVSMEKKDILKNFPENDHQNICRIFDELQSLYNEIKDSSYYNLSSNFLKEGTEINHRKYKFEEKHSNSFSVHIKNAFKLHTKPMFLLICLCRTVHFWTFMQLVSVCVDASKDKNIPEDHGKYILAALSAGDLLGRIGVGWITDKGYISVPRTFMQLVSVCVDGSKDKNIPEGHEKYILGILSTGDLLGRIRVRWITDKGYISVPRYMLIVMILQGAATATLPSVQGEALVMTCLAFIAFFTGSAFVRHPVLVSTYIENHEQAIAMGCINFFSGISGLTMPSFIGYFRDTLGSYDGIFYVNGAIAAAIGLLWIFEPCFLKYSKEGEKEIEPCRV